uniref:CSON006108 protein n=1 Tax=Culicoides sonorensis TaxID=179676 RepID=A0A336M7T7_CULSO
MLNLIIFVIILLLFYFEVQRIKLNNRFKHVKGPRQYPIIGSIFSIKSNKLTDFKAGFEELTVAPVSKFVFSGYLMLLVSHPEVLSQILPSKSFLERPYMIDFIDCTLGLLSSKFKIWKPMRKQTNLAFSQRCITNMFPVFNKHIDVLIKKIETHLNGPTFDINQLARHMGSAQVIENLMGYSDIQEELDLDLFESYEDQVIERVLNPFYQPWIVFRLSYMYQIHLKGRKLIHDIFGKIVNRRMQESHKINGEGKLFLDEMMRFEIEGKKLNYIDLVENIGLMYLAAYETSALTISYAILMLAMHPEFDEILQKEIKENYKKGEYIDFDMLKNFRYLDMVVKETLRHFPTVPLTARESMEDCKIGKNCI